MVLAGALGGVLSVALGTLATLFYVAGWGGLVVSLSFFFVAGSLGVPVVLAVFAVGILCARNVLLIL